MSDVPGLISPVSFLLCVVFSTTAVVAQEQQASSPEELWEVAHEAYLADDLSRARSLLLQAERVGGPHWYSARVLGAIAENSQLLGEATRQYRRSLDLGGAEDLLFDDLERVSEFRQEIEAVIQQQRNVHRDLWFVSAGYAAAIMLAYALIRRS